MSVAVLDERHRHQALRALQKARNVAWVETFLLALCVSRHDGRSMAATDALKLSYFAHKVTSILLRSPFFVAIVKFLINCSAVFKKEHVVTFHLVRMVDVVKDSVSSDFLTGNGPQEFQCYIQLVKFFRQRHNIHISIAVIDVKEAGSKTLGILHLGCESCPRPGQRKDRFLSGPMRVRLEPDVAPSVTCFVL